MRDATIKEINRLANHPSIYPSTGLPEGGIIDMAPVLVCQQNVSLISAPGAMVFILEDTGVFDCHFLFLPSYSGKIILCTARSMLKEMFTNRGACVITGRPPRVNRAVRCIGNALGFSQIPNSNFIDTLGRICVRYELKAEQCH